MTASGRSTSQQARRRSGGSLSSGRTIRPSRGSRAEAQAEKASERQNGQVRIGRGVWATRLRANGLAEGTKLRSGVKRIRAVTRIDLAQDDREARRLRSLLRTTLLERDSIVGGGQQPSPLGRSSSWGIQTPRVRCLRWSAELFGARWAASRSFRSFFRGGRASFEEVSGVVENRR